MGKSNILFGLCKRFGIETAGKDQRQLWKEVNEAKQQKVVETANRMGIVEEDVSSEEYAFTGAEIPTSTDAIETIDFGKIKNVKATTAVYKTIGDVVDKYKLNRIKSVRVEKLPISTYGKTNGNELILSELLLKFPEAAYHRSVIGWRKNNELRRKELESGELQKRYTEDGLLKEKMKVNFDRDNVIYAGKEIETTVLHEMGHIVAAQLFGQIGNGKYLQDELSSQLANRKARLIEQTYMDAINDGTIYEISYYASKNEREFFAECFVIKHIGKEHLPERINKMIEEVIK